MSPSQKRNEQNKRLDYWLWSARFYKTRTLANTAIKSGKVSSEGIRLKPSHQLKGGELLEIKKNPYCWKIRVLDFSPTRGSAEQASTLYRETVESRIKREELSAQLKLSAKNGGLTKGRPGKRDRRKIIRFTRKLNED